MDDARIVQIPFPAHYTDEQIEEALKPQPDTTVQDALSGLSEAIGSAFNKVEVEGLEIPETKLNGVEKSLKAIEKAITSIETPTVPDNKEVVQALVMVAKAINDFSVPETKIPEYKTPKFKVNRKRHVIDGQEVYLIDSIEPTA